MLVARESAVRILANLIWNVEQNTGHVVGLSGGGAAIRRRTRSGCRLFFEVELPCCRIVISLQKIVADAADVGASLQGVVAQNLGPVVCEIDIGLGAKPGQ